MGIANDEEKDDRKNLYKALRSKQNELPQPCIVILIVFLTVMSLGVPILIAIFR